MIEGFSSPEFVFGFVVGALFLLGPTLVMLGLRW
jgi:hypothetical protein